MPAPLVPLRRDRTDHADSPLAQALRREIDGEVRFDRGTRALYATDSSNYRQVPIGAVIPRTIDALITAVGLCREYGAPIFARGGGTSLAGQARAAAAGQDRHAVLAAGRDGGHDVVERLRDHHADRHLPVIGAVGRIQGAAAGIEPHLAANCPSEIGVKT